MRVHAVFASLLLATTLFAGCFGGDDGSPASATTGTTSATGGTGGTTDGPGGNGSENQAPVASLKLLSNGTELAATNGSFEVPAGENVTLDASGSSDPDGDELMFAWTIDGNESESSNASIEIAFESGNHTINLTVSDGLEQSAASLAVVAVGGASGGAIYLTFTGSVEPGTVEGDGKEFAFDIPAPAQKLVVHVTYLDTLTTEYGYFPPTTDFDVYVLDPAKKEIAASESTPDTDFPYLVVSDPAALVAGQWKVNVVPFNVPLGADYTVAVMVFLDAPKKETFTGSVQGGVNAFTTVTGLKTHTVKMPEGVQGVAARLTWSTQGQTGASRIANDFDLRAAAGTKAMLSSGTAGAYEFDAIAATAEEPLAGGDWTFTVTPFTVAAADYTLVVEYV